jgi:hypothetical protein
VACLCLGHDSPSWQQCSTDRKEILFDGVPTYGEHDAATNEAISEKASNKVNRLRLSVV